MRRLLLAVLLGAATMPARAAVVRWTDSRPPHAVTAAVEAAVRGIAGDSLSASAARAALYRAGYYWPVVQATRDTLDVDAGPAGQPGDVRVSGPAGSDSTLVAASIGESLLGRTDSASIARALAAAVDVLAESGYLFAQARLAAVDIAGPPSVDFTIAVFPGPFVHAGALLPGATRTPASFFAREIDWRRGLRLDLQRLRDARATVGALDFVTGVDTALLVSVAADTADVYLGVREAPALRVGGVAGWNPASAGRAGYWTGQLDLDLRSPFGDGRSVRVQAARRDPDSRRTRVEYWQPWPVGAPFWLGLVVAQNDFDTNFIETTVGAALRLAGGGPRWEFGAEWAKVVPEERPADDTYPARRYAATVAVSDSVQSSGYRIDLAWSRNRLFNRGSVIPPEGPVDHTQGRFVAHRAATLTQRTFVRLVAEGAGTLVGSSFIPSNLLFRVGGVHSLRGYREEQFQVGHYLRAAVEWHAGSRQQSIFVFGEGAWLSFPARADRIVGAAGVGLRASRRVELTLAVPSDGGFDQAKLHIALSTGG
jgi:outer membrane protein assembly factor BamA